MALLNPRFDDAGVLSGEAAHWTLSAVTSIEAIAGFGDAPAIGWEDFESWYPPLGSLDDVTIVRAFFGSGLTGYEAFERGWANDVYLIVLPPAVLVTCPFGSGSVEDCEEGWANSPFLTDWSDVAAVVGSFDGEPREDFEEQWRSNQLFAWNWSTVTSSVALFDSGSQGLEDFENAWSSATTI